MLKMPTYYIRRHRYAMLCLFVLLQIFINSTAVAKESDSLKHIDILLSANKSRYLEIANSIKQNVPNKRYSFRVLHHDELSLNEPSSELIITIGLAAANRLALQKPTIPIISVYIPQYAYRTLLSKNAFYTKKYFVGAIFIDQPLQRQLRFVHSLVPKATDIGMILGPISSGSIVNKKALFVNESFKLSTLNVLGNDIDIDRLNRFMTENDVILTLPDPIVHQPLNAKRILYNAYRAKTPVIAFSKAYVNAGALGAIYVLPDQVGRQTAEKINDYFLETKSSREKFETSEYFEVSINRNVAWTLDIRVPNEKEVRRRLIQRERDDGLDVN